MKLRGLHAGVAVAVVAIVAVTLKVRSCQDAPPSSTQSGLDQAPACIGDKSCAVDRVETVRSVAKSMNHQEARGLASALKAGLVRDDCNAATELAGGLERLDINRATQGRLADAVDSALMGREGYCALKRKAIDAPPFGSTIRLERGMCEGQCPAYAVTVTSEGEVTFEGAVFTVRKGVAKAKIATPAARELFDAFEALSFGKRKAHVGQDIDDAPNAKLVLTRGGATTTIEDGASCMATDSIEEGVCYLEARTDEIAQTAKWVSGPRDK